MEMQAGITASILALLLVMASGCASKHEPSLNTPTTSTGRTSSSQTSTDDAQPPVSNLTTNRIELTHCTGFLAGTTAMPTQVTPGSVPPGWERDPTDPESYVIMSGYECDRVHVGPYERGPVRMVWDVTGNGNVPDSCFEKSGGNPVEAVVNIILFDDEQIANYLHQSYGMPTGVAEIHVSQMPVGALVLRQWSWGVKGQSQSNLTVADDGSVAPRNWPDVLFWPHSQGVGKLVISYQRNAEAYTERMGYGTLQPPMLLAQLPGGAFAGSATYFPSMAGMGNVTLFKDNQCKQPEP